MTHDQIEAQRKKFEKKNPVPDFIEFSDDKFEYQLSSLVYRKFQEIEYYIYNGKWIGWLKCVESNEIELPKPFLQFDTVKAVYVSDLIIALEQQGFKVKA